MVREGGEGEGEGEGEERERRERKGEEGKGRSQAQVRTTRNSWIRHPRLPRRLSLRLCLCYLNVRCYQKGKHNHLQVFPLL